jgi:transcriptional regulator with XRE-family HTH domain
LPQPDYAKLLKELRDKLSLTQAEAGEKLQITQAYVSTIEAGGYTPSAKVAEKIMELSGASPERVNFAEWLREQRKKAGLTQEQLAEKAGISQLTISFIETGKTESPQKATVDAVEKVLGKLPGKIQSEIAEEAKVEGIGEYRGPFPIDEYKANVQDSTEGIYVFYDSLKRPVRVGQTDDLKRRIFEYKRDTWWCRPPTVESFAYIVLKDSKLRRQVEATMIKLVGDNAIFNIQHKI